MKEITIAGNKFSWDGKLLRVQGINSPECEIAMTKAELKDFLEINKLIQELH